MLKGFGKLASIAFSKKLNFRVLRGFEGTADAEILDNNSIMLIETKIFSGTLRSKQIKRHLKMLDKYNQRSKKLILLTPDSENSHYISQFIKISPKKIVHISWNSIIQLLQKNQSKDVILNELLTDYIHEIRENIFEQDISAVIVKINFGDKSGVYEDDYIKEFENGEWDDWHTHTEYKNLDGTGRKLLLYDPKRKAITIEVEIERVKYDPKHDKYFCWSNRFVSSKPKFVNIPLQRILQIPKTIRDIQQEKKDRKSHGFCNFIKTQTTGWNLTRKQYEWLMRKNENI